MVAFALFDTAVGRCGIAWSARGVAGVQLPERDESATRVRLRRRFPGADEAMPPSHIRHTMEEITRLLRSERRDLSAIELDMDGVPEFNRRVYAVARTCPAGATLSYGEIAARLEVVRLPVTRGLA